MATLSSAAILLIQDAGQSQDAHHISWALIVIAVALVMQAVAVMAVAFYASKLLIKVNNVTDTFDRKTDPILAKATALLDELGPRVKSITANVEQISYTARAKVDDLASSVDQLNRTVQDINERSRVQVSRVDGIVSDALSTAYEVSRTVQEGIKTPVRQVAGLVAGLRAGVDTLIARSPFGSRRRPGPYDL